MIGHYGNYKDNNVNKSQSWFHIHVDVGDMFEETQAWQAAGWCGGEAVPLHQDFDAAMWASGGANPGACDC